MTTYEMVQQNISNHSVYPDTRRLFSTRAFSFVDETVRTSHLNSRPIPPLLQPHQDRVQSRPWKLSPDDIQEGVRFPLKQGTRVVFTDPCQSWMSPVQQKFIARDMYRLLRPIYRDTCAIEALGRVDLNKKRAEKIRAFCQSQMSHELLNAFYSKSSTPRWWIWHDWMATDTRHDDDQKVYYHLLTKFCYDAVGMGQQTLQPKYRTATVMGLVRHMRATEEWNFPVLADALGDADFGSTPQEEALLTHYRTSRFFGLGSWIFRSTGSL